MMTDYRLQINLWGALFVLLSESVRKTYTYILQQPRCNETLTNFNSQCFQLFSSSHRVLSSAEVLSTDEESSDSGESDDELGRNLESLLSSKKTAMELTHEQEEIERQELRRLLLEDQPVCPSVCLFVCLFICYLCICLLHQNCSASNIFDCNNEQYNVCIIFTLFLAVDR